MIFNKNMLEYIFVAIPIVELMRACFFTKTVSFMPAFVKLH